ncbi:hypothetical protein EOL70_13385 [Leucothrix sargassi]|nr:hypothetical protein EOL70_13385 [Leucothrix sargassi]
MDLTRAMHKKHGELINVVNEQEELAIKAVMEKFSVIRVGIDQSFGIERASVKANTGLEIAPELGTDEDVPMDTKPVALGATS